MVTATRPEPRLLEGRLVRLDPFSPADAAALAEAIQRPEVFAGGYAGGPSALPADADGFARFLHANYADGPTEDALPWTVRLARDVAGVASGTVVGVTKLGDLDLENESAHIGWTAYAPAVWGTGVNVETKLLLLTLAFDHGFGRVKLQADAVNARSRAAIERLGAQFEGILRRAKRRPDGTWRDTVVYSILVDEWPAVRAGLEARLTAR